MNRLRTENPAGVARGVTNRGREHSEDDEHQHLRQRQLTVQSLTHRGIAEAKDAGEAEGEKAYHDAPGGRLKPASPPGHVQESLPHAQHQLDESYGDQATYYAQNGVDDELAGVQELVFGHAKQRLVTEKEPKHEPRGRGANDDGAENRGMKIAHDLLEREEHGRDGGVEGRRERGRCAHRDKQPEFLRWKSDRAPNHRRDAGPDLNRRPFSAERDPARERRRGAQELAKGRAPGDVPSARVEGRFRLRYAAPPCVGKEPIEQHPHAQRHEDRRDEKPPPGSVFVIERRLEVVRDNDESDNDEPDERADEQCENEKNLVLVPHHQLPHPLLQSVGPLQDAAHCEGSLAYWHHSCFCRRGCDPRSSLGPENHVLRPSFERTCSRLLFLSC